MKKFHNPDNSVVGPYHGARHGKVLEDTVHYKCDLCGNTLKKKITYSSYSNICIFPKIEDYMDIICKNCGELFYLKKIKRKFINSNEIVEYEVIGKEILKKNL